MKILTLLLFFSTQLFAEDLPNHYSLKVIDAAHHLAEVQIKFNAVNDKTFEVKLPVWRSGRYEILDLSKTIRYFSATDSENKPLNWHKTNKNSWNIALEKPGSVIIKYQVYANELKKRVSHIDQTHAFIDASGVFMFNQSQRGKALTVKLDVAESWQSRSGLSSIGD
ncbi:MAG: M61 family peptidase, partial [Proteobacteria bacterium]|nr:M61 family peptidase [Pseudomonadota bacterium]